MNSKSLSTYEQCPSSGTEAHVNYGDNSLLRSQIMSVYSSSACKASKWKAENKKERHKN